MHYVASDLFCEAVIVTSLKSFSYSLVSYITHLWQACHNSKFLIFQEKLLKVLKCYNFLWVQRRHNCSLAASFANCDMTLYLLKVNLQTFLSIPITKKMPNFELWHTCRKWAIYCCWVLSLFLDLSCVYFNICTFGYQTGKEKVLDHVVVGIPRVQSAVSFFFFFVTC